MMSYFDLFNITCLCDYTVHETCDLKTKGGGMRLRELGKFLTLHKPSRPNPNNNPISLLNSYGI